MLLRSTWLTAARGCKRPPGARTVGLTACCALKAHILAWQARRGARHNAYSVNPKGPA